MVNFFGSNASRIASPMKVTRTRTDTSAPNAEATIQGAFRLEVPWRRSSPQLGVGGGKPYPRKSRAVSEEMETATVNGANVTKVESALGRTCLKMIRVVL